MRFLEREKFNQSAYYFGLCVSYLDAFELKRNEIKWKKNYPPTAHFQNPSIT
jgi:hypothetical protein